MQTDENNLEEKIEDSFDHFQPIKTEYLEEAIFDLKLRKKTAKNLAKKIIKLAKVASVPVSLLQVTNFLNDSGQYILDIVPNPDFTKKISAQLVKTKLLDEEINLIGYNPSKPHCHQLFSVAHELGHLLFNTTHEESGNRKSDFETEANIFASHLLIPEEFIKGDLKKIKNIDLLAEKYRVHKDTMGWRIQDGNLWKLI
jgi:hypothetical protein